LFAVLFNGLRRSTYFKVVGRAVVVLVLGEIRVLAKFSLAVDAFGRRLEPFDELVGELPEPFSS